MMPNPIIFRSAERRGSTRIVVLDELVGEENIVRSLELDELTFAGIERAFRNKRSEDDMVLFKSLNTPLETDKMYFGLQIVNSGSRHYLKIEASPQAFAAMKEVFDSWSDRMARRRSVRRTPS